MDITRHESKRIYRWDTNKTKKKSQFNVFIKSKKK